MVRQGDERARWRAYKGPMRPASLSPTRPPRPAVSNVFNCGQLLPPVLGERGVLDHEPGEGSRSRSRSGLDLFQGASLRVLPLNATIRRTTEHHPRSGRWGVEHVVLSEAIYHT